MLEEQDNTYKVVSDIAGGAFDQSQNVHFSYLDDRR